MTQNTNYSKGIYTLLFIITTIICCFVLKTLHTFILPVLFAIFLSFVFIPIVNKIHTKTKIPWSIISIFIVLILIIVISVTTFLLSTGVTTIISEYPKYEVKFQNIILKLISVLPINYDEGKGIIENLQTMVDIPGIIQTIGVPVSSGIVSFIKSLFIILILFLFLLLEANYTKDKIKTIFEKRNKSGILYITKKIVSQVVRYLSIKFFISLGTGILVYFGTLIIGLNFPIVWAFIAFVMNFIPTFGSIISVGVTTIFSLMQFYPEWGKIIFVFIFMLSTNFLLGNIIEPKIEGDNLDLSIFVIIVCILFWSWVWGFTGMILAVPLTVIIKIICENIEFLHPIAIFLSNDPIKAKQNLKKI